MKMSDWLWFALTSAAFVLLGKQPQPQPQQSQQQQSQQQHNAVVGSSVWNKDWVWSVSSKTNRPHWFWPIHRSTVLLRQSNNNNNNNKNRQWHRATYLVIHHVPTDTILLWNSTTTTKQPLSSSSSSEATTLLQLPNDMVGYGESYFTTAQRIQTSAAAAALLKNSNAPVQRLFGFRFSPGNDNGINVWGELYQTQWNESLEEDYPRQQEQEQTICMMPFGQMMESLQTHSDGWTLDARYVLGLYQQHCRLLSTTTKRQRRRLPQAIFFDCDDCLYFDGWVIADELTQRIEDWCVDRHGLAKGQAYRLYKQHGTCLRGLLAEGYMGRNNNDDDIDEFLNYVHDLGIEHKLQPDPELRRVLLSMDPSVPKYVFTASVRHHAERVLRALGIEDLFVDIIDVWVCGMETKHSPSSFRAAMQVAGIEKPSSCLLLDDSVRNLQAANQMGWRSVLVGRVGRDCGKPVTAKPHSESEIDRIHDLPQALPELFMW